MSVPQFVTVSVAIVGGSGGSDSWDGREERKKEERKGGRNLEMPLWLSWFDLGFTSNLFSQICDLEQCHFTSQDPAK